ncbi:MAG TPA: hypothetical protein VEA40_00750 [Ramlibacter sp.]|nr:hypothetical protein [Ramlibacter sp.]
MIRTGTLRQSLANRRPLQTPDGTHYFKSDFIQSQPEDAVAPQAFLIEQAPNSVIRPHFHQENQFQVVVGGGAELGRHAVAPVSVHYASRHTGYGPITSGAQGVSYFSLRDRVTALAYYLPESRELMEDVPRRNLFADHVPVAEPAQLRALHGVEATPVLPLQADGVAAWAVRLAPGASHWLPLPAGGADRFHLVLSGAVVRDGESLPRLATVFASAQETPLVLQAGDDGAQVLVLQFPQKGVGLNPP